MSLANRLTTKIVAREIARASLTLQQARAHHPDPFNPQTTRGWKAALKVRSIRVMRFVFARIYASDMFHCRLIGSRDSEDKV